MSSCEHNLRRVKIRDWLQGYESRFHERLVKRGGMSSADIYNLEQQIKKEEEKLGKLYQAESIMRGYKQDTTRAKEEINKQQGVINELKSRLPKPDITSTRPTGRLGRGAPPLTGAGLPEDIARFKSEIANLERDIQRLNQILPTAGGYRVNEIRREISGKQFAIQNKKIAIGILEKKLTGAGLPEDIASKKLEIARTEAQIANLESDIRRKNLPSGSITHRELINKRVQLDFQKTSLAGMERRLTGGERPADRIRQLRRDYNRLSKGQKRAINRGFSKMYTGLDGRKDAFLVILNKRERNPTQSGIEELEEAIQESNSMERERPRDSSDLHDDDDDDVDMGETLLSGNSRPLTQYQQNESRKKDRNLNMYG
jgi:hypothetical protein